MSPVRFLVAPLPKAAECSAVGSALRSGRRGRAFESPHSDRKRQAVKIACRFSFSYPPHENTFNPKSGACGPNPKVRRISKRRKDKEKAPRTNGSQSFILYSKRDLNPHSHNGQRILSPSCLPFHHSSILKKGKGESGKRDSNSRP